MSLKDDFIQLGLTPEEAEVYFILINKGPKTFQDLVGAKILDSGLLSKTLTELIKAGLIEINVNKDKDLYEPTSPFNFQALIEHDKKLSLKDKNLFNSIFPIVLNLYNLNVRREKIKCLEGKEGIKVIYDDILLEAKDEILIFRSRYDDPLTGYLNKYHVEKRARAGIHTKILVDKTPTPQILAEDQRLLKERRVVPIDLPCEINIYGDRVSFFDYRSRLAGMTVEDPDLADSLRNIFNKLWEMVPPIKD